MGNDMKLCLTKMIFDHQRFKKIDSEINIYRNDVSYPVDLEVGNVCGSVHVPNVKTSLNLVNLGAISRAEKSFWLIRLFYA